MSGGGGHPQGRGYGKVGVVVAVVVVYLRY